MSTLPILYSFRRCPYAMRARLALAYAGVEVEHREILLRDKPQSMLALSPKGTVPVLQLTDGKVLDESIDVMHWALSQNDPDAWIMDEPEKQAKTTALIEHNDGPFKQALDHYKYFTRFPKQPREAYRADGEVFLQQLENCLQQNAEQGLVRENASLADMAIFPFIRQFAGADAKWFAAAPYPMLRGWLGRHVNSPLFIGVMKKYALWAD